MYLGIDVGFGWTKYAFGEGNGTGLLQGTCNRYPSVVATILPEAVSLDMRQERLRVFQGKHYLVGEDAVQTSDAVGGREADYMLKHGPLFLVHTLRQISQKQLSGHTIGLGLPPSNYRRNMDQVKASMSRIEMDGQVIENDIAIFPQGAVAILEWNLTHQDVQDVLMVDVGHNTVDVITVRARRGVPEESGSINRAGVSMLLDKLIALVQQKHDIQLNGAEAALVLTRGVLMKHGERIPLQEDIKALVEQYTNYLCDKLTDRWGDHLKKVEHLVLMGGGATIVERHLPDEYRRMACVMARPEYANARGYLHLIAGERGVILG